MKLKKSESIGNENGELNYQCIGRAMKINMTSKSQKQDRFMQKK